MASFIATSFASAPLFERNAASSPFGVHEVSFSRKVARTSL